MEPGVPSPFNVFHITCNILIVQHSIQHQHSEQQAVTCQFTVCLLLVSASTWPSSGRSPTKEYNNGRFCYRCACVESNWYFSIKILKHLKYRLITNTSGVHDFRYDLLSETMAAHSNKMQSVFMESICNWSGF
jgi:hypothetical protein